jgi:LCP family protein required for cell wall assembly
MDDFHNLKRPNKHVRSIDGFVTPRPMSRRTKHEGVARHHNIQPGTLAQPRLDNFRAPDGFRPAVAPRIAQPNQTNRLMELSPQQVAPHARGQLQTHEITHEPKKHGGIFGRRSKHAGHKQQARHKRRWLKVSLASSGVLVLLVLLTVGFIFGKAYFKTRNIFKGGGSAAALSKNVDPTLLKGEGDGRVNILLLGKGGPGHDGPDLTDTLLVASIDPIQKEAALLSIPRDLYVKTPDQGSMKINAVYANAKNAILNRSSKKTADVQAQAEKAGMDAIESMITQTMGIPMHYYVMVDFAAFKESIDTVGGVDINVKTALYDPTVAWENGNNPLIAAAGEQHMDGKKALLYSRSRHGSARGDFDRTERQREVLLSLKTKVLTLGTFGNPLKVSQLIDAFGNHVSTNFKLDEVMRVYDLAKDIDGSKVQSIGLADPPNDYVTTSNIDNQSVVIPKAGVGNYSAIQGYVRNTLKDSFLKNENASVVVLNGTDTAGLASKKADELKSYGYNVTKVDTAPTSHYTTSVLVDLTNGTKKYTKRYLEQRLNVTSTTSLPDNSIPTTGVDFVIILGSDAATTTGQN